MKQQVAGPLFGFMVAQEIDTIDVEGGYDQDVQLWVGGDSVSACMTNTYSGTSCRTSTASSTLCGMDIDSDVDQCGDFDEDGD